MVSLISKKPKARIHVLVSATISTSLRESEPLNYRVLSPTHFFVHYSQPPHPTLFAMPTFIPLLLCPVFWLQQRGICDDFSEEFCFRAAITYGSCVHMHTISRIHNTSTGFLGIIIFTLYVLWMQRATSFIFKVGRNSVSLWDIVVLYTGLRIHSQYSLPFYVKFTKASNHEINVIIKY